MAFVVIDRQTDEIADTSKIVNESWAADLMKFDEYEWAKTESGQLLLADKLFNVAYADPIRFVAMDKSRYDEIYRPAIREDIDNFEIGLNDGMTSVGIYIGNLDDLHKVLIPQDRCKYYADHAFIDSGYYITLKDISDYYAYRDGMVITVFVNAFTTGDIFQYGNHHDKHWYRLGKLKGYA